MTHPFPVVDIEGMEIARIDRHDLLEHVFSELRAGNGGWVVTANIDFVRRHVVDPQMRTLYGAADIRVADGMPLLWAARIQGVPLPERVAGSSLVGPLAERAAAEDRSVYLLGGDEGAAASARDELVRRYPKLVVCGVSSPWVTSPPTAAELEAIAGELASVRPDILLVGLGSPKQEQVIWGLRARLGGTWMLGVGMSFSFVAGSVRRAPPWLQRLGLEWAHRLAHEPRRLARRYLVEDLPFAFGMLARSCKRGASYRAGRSR